MLLKKRQEKKKRPRQLFAAETEVEWDIEAKCDAMPWEEENKRFPINIVATTGTQALAPQVSTGFCAAISGASSRTAFLQNRRQNWNTLISLSGSVQRDLGRNHYHVRCTQYCVLTKWRPSVYQREDALQPNKQSAYTHLLVGLAAASPIRKQSLRHQSLSIIFCWNIAFKYCVLLI